MGQVHDIIGNCTRCGRIVCVQEGAGPCLYCGEFVASKKQLEYFATGTNKALAEEARLRRSVREDARPEEWGQYYGMNFFLRDLIRRTEELNRSKSAKDEPEIGFESDVNVENTMAAAIGT